MHFCIVKRNVSFSSFLPIILILLVTAVISFMTLSMFVYIPFIVAATGIIVAMYVAPSLLRTEYEYNIEGDLFTISIIRNKSSRKEIFSSEIPNLVSCVPFDERDAGAVITKKIVAASEENTTYYAIFSSDEQTTSVTFSPSEVFIKELRLLSPRKVKINILN